MLKVKVLKNECVHLSHDKKKTKKDKKETVMHAVNAKYTSTRAEIYKLIKKYEAVSFTADI